MILTDLDILSRSQDQKIISPFEKGQVAGNKMISYGLSSMGYDIRLGYNFLGHEKLAGEDGVIDPKRTPPVHEMELIRAERGQRIIIPPCSLTLAESIEIIEMPDDCSALVTDKSTYRRNGLIVGGTVLEPSWRGIITLELINPMTAPIAVYPGEGIAQLLFFSSAKRPHTTYRDRNGKYQNQSGLTIARLL